MNQPIINKSMLEVWKEVDSQNWKALVHDIINIFFEFGPDQYKELKDVWENKNYEKAGALAHSLKSSCGNVGAELASHILGQIEKTVLKGDYKQAGDLMNQLLPVFESTINELNEFRKTI